MRGRPAMAVLLLAAACSLPLPQGVQVHRGPAVLETDPGDIQVMPPGPQQGASPEAVVRGFLGAESSPEGGHAIARRFLTTDARWADDQVVIYDPASVRIRLSEATSVAAIVSMTCSRLGQVDQDGRYASAPPSLLTETYPLTRDARGQWRITDPPTGVRLTPADRERSFPARRLYFLSSTTTTALHVVPDQVMLPVDGPPGVAEVRRLLAGPSSAVAGSVRTGFPKGTRLVRMSSASGSYQVALSRQALGASDLQRQSLSAQLVWTLRSLPYRFRGLRLSVNGRPFAVPGEGDVQRPGDWDAFDPEDLAPGPAYFVAGGRLHTLVNGKQGAAPAGALRDSGVLSAAVTPDRKQLALLLAGPGGAVTVRMGAASAEPPVGYRAPGLSSPTWGTGERGLWLLDKAGRILLLAPGRAVTVPVVGVTDAISWLAISRDGVRAALVIHGGLYVGRLADSAGGLRVVAAAPIAPELTGVTRVAWRDPTTLVALGAVSGTFVPVVIGVDGSGLRPLPVAGLPSRAEEVAASSLGVLVTASGRLYLLTTLGFRAGPAGRAVAYPG